MSSCTSTSQRSYRRTSIRIPPPRHQHRHPSPPPPARAARVTPRNTRPKQLKAEIGAGCYTLSHPTFDHRGREIRSEIWQPDREEEYIALYGQRFHEQVPRRPRARTIASSQESGRARVPSSSPPSSPLDHPQLRQTCPATSAAKSEFPSTTRRRDSRRKQSMRGRPANIARRDSGYESDDADGDTSNEENGHGRDYDSCTRIPTSRSTPPTTYSRTVPFGRSAGYSLPGLDIRSSLPRPASPSNESSTSTDDDNTPANVNPHALEYYLGNDDTWRETEIFSQSSEDSGLSDDDNEMPTRYSNGTHHPDMLTTSLSSFDMGAHSHTYYQMERRRRHPHRAPRMPKRLPLVPTCSSSRKRASMRGAWKMRFGRLFESDSEAGTEVEDELDWEGYESADARRIVAMRIHKAGGGDGRKIMEGKEQLAELLVKQPIDHRRQAARVPRRSRADTTRGRELADASATIQPLVVDTCTTCASALSPSLSVKSIPATATESPTSTSSASLATPTSTPTSMPNTPCPTCAQLSPRGDALQLALSPFNRHKVLSPRSPPCKTTPLGAGTDPLTIFAVRLEKEKQRDLSGLLKHSSPPPESMLSTVGNGLLRSVKSFFIKLNNFVDFAANAPLPTSVDGTCPLSPVMAPGSSIARDIGNRRRSASVPEVSPAPRSRSQRRRSYLRSPTGSKNQLSLPGAPTSPYGYRVRPQQVSAAFPVRMSSNERMGNVAPTPVPSVESVESMPSALELKAVLARPVEADTPVYPEPLPIVPIDLKGPPANNAEVRRRRASRSPSRRRTSTKRSESGKSSLGTEKSSHSATMETNRDEMIRSRAVIDSKYWRVLAGEMEQRRQGGVEVAFMVRLAVEEGRNLPIFTSEEHQAATGEIVVGGVWKATLARWRVGGVGKGSTRIRSSLVNEISALSDASDLVSDSSVSS